MARLPIVGSDINTWGQVLLDFLAVSFNNDGTLKASAAGVTRAVTLTAHGFNVGDVLRFAPGSGWTTAQADSAANADVDGIVSAVTDADHFTIVAVGWMTGLSGLVAGTDYFLSSATAGLLTATEPSVAGQVSKPVFHADSTTSGFVQIQRGLVIPSPAITYFAVQLVDETTSVTTGEGKAHFTVPSDLNGLSLVSVVATVAVAPSGSALSFGVRKNAATEMLSTNVTIDTTKVTSELSATPPVINAANKLVATGDVIWIDCDQADSGNSSRASALRLGFS